MHAKGFRAWWLRSFCHLIVSACRWSCLLLVPAGLQGLSWGSPGPFLPLASLKGAMLGLLAVLGAPWPLLGLPWAAPAPGAPWASSWAALGSPGPLLGCTRRILGLFWVFLLALGPSQGFLCVSCAAVLVESVLQSTILYRWIQV